MSKRQHLFILVGILTMAAAIRTWAAVSDHSIFWPDEIYQSLEPAHRVAFGNGLEAWEFRDGARSWLFPGLLALVLRAGSVWGVQSGIGLVVFARLFMVALALVSVWASMRLAERLAGRAAAWLAGAMTALSPPLIVFGHRCMPEMMSATLIVVVALWITSGSRWRHFGAGFLMGAAVFLRYQNGLVALGFLIWLALQRRRIAAAHYLAALLCAGLGGAILDWLTWGVPLHSFFAYVQFNLLENGASRFGTESSTYYFVHLFTATGPAFVAVAIGFVACASRLRGLALIVLAYLFAHSLIPHKELRFALPILPLLLSLSAVGIVMLANETQYRRRWLAAITVTTSALFALQTLRPTFGEYGQYLQNESARKRVVWHSGEAVNRVLSMAGQRDDICGVMLLARNAAWTGGYSYLHRKVPLFWRLSLADEFRANYIIAHRTSEETVPSVYQRVGLVGSVGLYRRDGGCMTSPRSVRSILPGADTMGLHPLTIPPAPPVQGG